MHPDDTRVRGEEVDPRLGRAAGHEPLPCDRGRQADGGVVLVEIADVGNEERDGARRSVRVGDHPRSGAAHVAAGEQGDLGGGQPPALGPALARDHQVAGEHRAGEGLRGFRERLAGGDADDPHPARARAVSIARRA